MRTNHGPSNAAGLSSACSRLRTYKIHYRTPVAMKETRWFRTILSVPHRTSWLLTSKCSEETFHCWGEFILRDLYGRDGEDDETQRPSRARWAPFLLPCQVVLMEISRNIQTSLQRNMFECWNQLKSLLGFVVGLLEVMIVTWRAEPMNRLIGFQHPCSFTVGPSYKIMEYAAKHPWPRRRQSVKSGPLESLMAQAQHARRLSRNEPWDTWCQPWSVGKSTIFV